MQCPKKEESSNEFLPAEPQNPEVLIENNAFILRWQSISTVDKKIWNPVTYSVELSTDNGVNWLLHADGVQELFLKLDILDYGKPYQLRVKAHDMFGSSEPTSPVRFLKEQPSISSFNHNRMELIEMENFFKAALLEDILCCSLKDVLKEELNSTYVSFENFINLHQHEIYHMCFSTKCCLCTAKSPIQYRKILNESHLGQIFDEDFRFPCHKKDGTSNCCCMAKKNISITVIDTYLTCVLLLYTCNNVFWHFCLDFHGFSLEELLNRNKHNLYHIWHGNTSCCQCVTGYMNKRRFPNDDLSKNDWKRLFSKRSIPCLLHTKKASDELVCNVEASRNIQIVDLRYGLQKIILDNVCPIKEKIILVLKDVIDLYAYSKTGMISCKSFTVIYDNLLRVITDITIIVPTENNYIGRIRNISEGLFDEAKYRITLMGFQKKYISIQKLNLIRADELESHSLENAQISTAKIENQGCRDGAIAECKCCNNGDQSQVCSNCDIHHSVSFTEGIQIIRPETGRDIKRIRKERCQQLLSMLCNEHAKKSDKFCISHQLPLCDDCMKIHVKCPVNPLKIVAKGVINSNQFKNIERRMHSLCINMNYLLPKLESDLTVITNEKESFQKSIENSKKELTFMLDKVKEEGLQIIESNSIKMRFFHNKMSILNISVVDKMNVIAMSRLHASESEIFVSLPRIEEDLQRFENRLFKHLLDKEIVVFDPIVKSKTFGELNIQVSYNPGKHMCQALSMILESFSVNMIQQIKDMQLDESFGFEVPKEEEVNILTGCTFLADGVLCFADSKSSRLILRSYDGIYKNFHLPSVPLDITAISDSKVAILHRNSIAIFSISDKRMNTFTFKSGGTFRFITFHNQNLVVCVSGCSFFIVTLQGQKIKEINIDETLISCISCWNNNIFYANRDKNTIYGVNLHTGKPTLIIHVGGIVNAPSCIVCDGSGKIFVIGSEDDNIVAISVYGKEFKELVRGFGNIQSPKMISYNSTQKRLLICSPIGYYSVYTFGS